MTKDDIVIMARAAGVRDDGHRFEFSEYKHLERFAALVAEQEREAGDMVVASMQVYVDRHHAVTLKMIERSAEKEREACAKWLDFYDGPNGRRAEAIRARGTP